MSHAEVGGNDEMDLAIKHELERTKWNILAARGLDEGDLIPEGVTFLEWVGEADENMSYVAADVQDFLGDLRGKDVLELGCGRGAYAALLARLGGKVRAVDLSESAIQTTLDRAELNGVEIEGVVAPGEDLPFEDETFDVAFGTSSLHHLEVDVAGPELWRVLKPGGKAFFLEPMGTNPVLQFTRDHVPYPYKTPRGEDRPVNYAEIEAWGKGFSQYWYRECQLFSMIERGFGFDRRFWRMRRMDRHLLERYRPLRRWARLVAMFGIK